MKTGTEQEATPRPWIAYPKPGDSNGGAPDIVVPTTYGGEHIAAFKRVEDRDFAVKAVNAYDADQEIIRELVEALEESMVIVCGDIAAHRGNEKANYRAFDLARLAIAKVKARHV